jgi:4-amino-4-deoxy-L-arabinose transferase-like glycosyltransferase
MTDESMTNQNYQLTLLAIFVVAVLIRVSLAAAFVGLNSPPDAGAQPHQVEYEALAWKPLAGEGYSWDGIPTARRMPGTSFSLMGVYAVFGRSYAAGRIWFCLMSAATCLAAASLATRLADRRTGVIAGAALAFYPNHAYFCMHFVSEVPYALCVTLATLSTLHCFDRDSKVGSAFGTGLVWGVTALIRSNVLVAVCLLWVIAIARKEFRVERLKKAAIVSAVCAVVLVPLVIRNKVQIGAPMLSSVGSYTFWGAHNEQTLETAPGSWIKTEDLADEDHPFVGTEKELNDLAWKYGKNFVREHMSDMPYLTAMKLYRVVSPFAETPNKLLKYTFAAAWCIAGPLFLIGAIVELRRNWWRTQIAGLAVWVTLATTLLFYGSIRFRDSIAPVYIAIGSIGLMALIRKFSSRTSKTSSV